MNKRKFDSAFKAQVVIEVISGEKSIDQAADEYNLKPNLIRNWRKEFLDNAPLIFDKAKNSETLIKQIDQLTSQVDWLKKKSEEIFGPDWENFFTPKS